MKNKKTISIIGFGRFGTLVAAVLAEDFEVSVYHYREKAENNYKADILGVELVKLEKAASADIVILAVPISKTEELIKQIVPLMKEGSALLDTCSVKTLPAKWLLENKKAGVDIIATHPMFGPVTTKFNLEEKSWDLSHKQIVLCPLTKTSLFDELKAYLEKLGIKVIVTTPEDHDEQNAKTLGLVHFLGRSLTHIGVGEQRIFTPGYTDLLSILPHTNQDDWQLFFDMFNYNPYAHKLLGEFLSAESEIEDQIIKASSGDAFGQERLLINKLDKRIMAMMEKRMECAKRIGVIKKTKGIPVIDAEREAAIIKARQEGSALSAEFIEKLYRGIFEESYKWQNNI